MPPDVPAGDDARAHAERIRTEFAAQASTFTGSGWAVRGIDWIVGHLAPAAHEIVLDVAAGAGHVGRALAPHVAHVSAIDITPEMLQQGDELAAAGGIANVAFLVGDAEALPWIDRQFDLVVCRLTLHQVHDPRAVVREMLRVVRPSGRVGVIDIVADDDTAIAAEMNRLERLRDPSHGRALAEREIRALLEDAGATIVTAASQDQPLDLEDWMARSNTPPAVRDAIRGRLDDEMAGGAPTGLRPFRETDGTVSFVHRWVLFVARPGA